MEKSIAAKRKAQGLVRKGQVQDAIEVMRSALSEGEPDPYDYVYLGDLLMRVKEAPEAIDAYQIAIRSYEQVGLYRNAIAIGKKVLRIEGGRAEVHRLLAELYDREGLKGESMPHYLAYLDSFSGEALPPTEFLETLDRAADSVGSKAEVALRLADHFMRVKRGDRAADLLETVAGLLGESGTTDMADDLRARAAEARASAAPPAPPPVPEARTETAIELDLPGSGDGAADTSEEPDFELEGNSLVAESSDSGPDSRSGQDESDEEDGVSTAELESDSDPSGEATPSLSFDSRALEAALGSGDSETAESKEDATSDSGSSAFLVEHFPTPGSPSGEETGEMPELDRPEDAAKADIVRAEDGSASTLEGAPPEDSEDREDKVWEIEVDEDEFELQPVEERRNESAVDLSGDDEDGSDRSETAFAAGAESEDEEREDMSGASDPRHAVDIPAPPGASDATGSADVSDTSRSERASDASSASESEDARDEDADSGTGREDDLQGRLPGGVLPARRAETAMARGRWAEARPLLEDLHQDRPRDRSILAKLVEVVRHLEDKEAETQYLCLLGDVWISENELEEALETFLQVLRIDPENVTAQRRLSRFRDLGVRGADDDQKQSDVEQLLHSGASEVSVRDEASFRNEDWAELEGLLEEFKDGLKNQLDESDFQGHYDLAVSYHGMGLYEEAIDALEHVLAVESLPPAIERQSRELKGSCYLGLCQFREAVHEFREALETSDDDVQGRRSALYHLGQALEAVEEWQEASKKYQQLTRESPGFLDVEQRLGRCIDRMKDDGASDSEASSDAA